MQTEYKISKLPLKINRGGEVELYFAQSLHKHRSKARQIRQSYKRKRGLTVLLEKNSKNLRDLASNKLPLERRLHSLTMCVYIYILIQFIERFIIRNRTVNPNLYNQSLSNAAGHLCFLLLFSILLLT